MLIFKGWTIPRKEVEICKPKHENYILCNCIFILLHGVLENHHVLSGLCFKICNISDIYSAFFFYTRAMYRENEWSTCKQWTLLFYHPEFVCIENTVIEMKIKAEPFTNSNLVREISIFDKE